MAENQQRTSGIPGAYKLDRGNAPTQVGMYIGEVRQVVDSTRSGRVRVWIEDFAGPDKNNPDLWRTVAPVSPFYGATNPPTDQQTGEGGYVANKQSYGMWFTPPDVGVTVICIFVNGDRSQGYYIGVVPDQGLGRMVPAMASVPVLQAEVQNQNQETYFINAPRLPVTEINTNNTDLFNNPRFFDGVKPVQSVVAQALLQQGLINDTERGTINSSSQRESPSAVFGISTPGTAVYQGGLAPSDARAKLNSGEVKPADLQVIGRMGGHTLVMDDGDIDGNNQLFRLRTAKGHQITMNDSGNFLYILHANGQTWIELGQEGTVDVFSTNSVNIRTQGDINLHADRDINMYAGRNIKAKAKENIQLQAEIDLIATAQQNLTLYSKAAVGIKADGSLALQSATGSWAGGGSLALSAGGIDLNGPAAASVTAPQPLQKTLLDDTEFDTSKGWQVVKNKLESVVTRAPTHEPWSYHNKGVDVEVALEDGKPTPPPGAPPVPAGVEISAT